MLHFPYQLKLQLESRTVAATPGLEGLAHLKNISFPHSPLGFSNYLLRPYLPLPCLALLQRDVKRRSHPFGIYNPRWTTLSTSTEVILTVSFMTWIFSSLSFSFSSVDFTLKMFIWTWSAQADSFNGARWHGWVFDLPFIKFCFALSQQAFYFRPKWRAEQAQDTWPACNHLVQVTFDYTKSIPTCEFTLETELREKE